MVIETTEIIAIISVVFNTIAILILLRRFGWDKKKNQKELEQERKDKDDQILCWITKAIEQQNEHCKLITKMGLNDLQSGAENMKLKQNEQNNEMKDMKTEINNLAKMISALTAEISNLKDAISKMETRK